MLSGSVADTTFSIVTGFVTHTGYSIGCSMRTGMRQTINQERRVMALQTCVNSVRGGKRIFAIFTDDGGYAMVHAASMEEAKYIANAFLLSKITDAREAKEHEVQQYKDQGFRVTYMN